MKENSKKSIHNKDNEEKDWYSGTIVCQFFLCLLLTLTVIFLIRSEGDFGESLKRRISCVLTESIDLSAAADKVGIISEIFGGSSLAVNGTVVTDIPSSESTAPSENEAAADEMHTDAVGGEDIKLLEAAEKTSFAPYITTDKFISPIENGRYTSYFGYRVNPVTGEWSFHTGLDIAADEGTKIRTALPGTVTTVGEDSRAGKYIIVTHSDSFKTFYCHCNEILAEEGMRLNKGETIALVGSTGWSTGPHLHFEVRRDNIRLNPLHALSDDC